MRISRLNVKDKNLEKKKKKKIRVKDKGIIILVT